MAMQTIGHDHIVTFFEQVMAAGNLSHAYCFVGIEGLGKRYIAEWLGQTVLGVSEKQFQSHPDVMMISQLQDEKTGKTKKNISVEQMRHARTFLQGKPFVGKYKIVIIDPADKMNEAASNALLKSLEEPSKQSLIILITTNHEALPQTIRSRCQTIFFAPVAEDKLIDGLIGEGVPKAHAVQLARVAHGCPGTALTWARNGQAYEQYQASIAQFTSLFGKPLYKKMQIVEPLLGDKSDHIGTREELQKTLAIWQLYIRDTIGTVEQKRSWQQLSDRITEVRLLLQKNVHPKLLIEHILLAID